MPRYKSFLQSIGFLGYTSAKGWTNLQQHLKKNPEQLDKIYKFAKLDQYELYDKLDALDNLEHIVAASAVGAVAKNQLITRRCCIQCRLQRPTAWKNELLPWL